jgi:hypothetical protein
VSDRDWDEIMNKHSPLKIKARDMTIDKYSISFEAPSGPNAFCERLQRPDFDIWGLGNVGPAHPKSNKNKDNDILTSY